MLKPNPQDDRIRSKVQDTLSEQLLFDNHGHLPPIVAGEKFTQIDSQRHSADKLLFGIDDLLTYHYNRQGFFGMKRDITQAQLDSMTPEARGDLIWRTMFVESPSAPIDVARLMILNILKRQGLDPNTRDLSDIRDFYREKQRDIVGYHEEVFRLAGVSGFVGTQDPFNPRELAFYESKQPWHPLFSAALRLDALVLKWKESQPFLSERLGYSCTPDLTDQNTIDAIKRFVADWITEKLPRVQYVGLSIPPTYTYSDYKEGQPKDDFSRVVNTILTKGVFPVLEETGRKLFLMPEVVRGITPAWREAGDYYGKGSMLEIARLAADHDKVDFWITPLNESSIQEVMSMARALPNVTSWGVWWYNLQPGIIDKTIRLGMDEVVADKRWQFNSDARVLEHLIGKWDDFRMRYSDALGDHFVALSHSGWHVTQEQIASHIRHDFDPERVHKDAIKRPERSEEAL